MRLATAASKSLLLFGGGWPVCALKEGCNARGAFWTQAIEGIDLVWAVHKGLDARAAAVATRGLWKDLAAPVAGASV